MIPRSPSKDLSASIRIRSYHGKHLTVVHDILKKTARHESGARSSGCTGTLHGRFARAASRRRAGITCIRIIVSRATHEVPRRVGTRRAPSPGPYAISSPSLTPRAHPGHFRRSCHASCPLPNALSSMGC